jgi:AcrR family transcriptional regulator
MKNKAETMRKLIDAVAFIFKNEGYAGLGVNKVARQAEVNKKLIYRYFGSFERLIEAYVVETDYWMRFAEHMRVLKIPENAPDMQRLLSQVLQNQFLYFQEDKEMQQLILWELSAKSDLMRSIHNTRESMGKQFLEMSDTYLEKKAIDFRAISALLVGGIYYMILHRRYNGGMFSDVDISSDHGRQAILDAIDQVVNMAFAAEDK